MGEGSTFYLIYSVSILKKICVVAIAINPSIEADTDWRLDAISNLVRKSGWTRNGSVLLLTRIPRLSLYELSGLKMAKNGQITPKTKHRIARDTI